MGDPEYWKRLYKHLWKSGSIRESMFVELMHNWGLAPVKFGFEKESLDYNPNAPIEKGIPDYYIVVHGERIYFEVTGTNVARVSPSNPLWVRPDKIDYVKRHRINGYVCHILNNQYNRIRFINLNEIKQKRIIYKYIRGVRETYVEIPSDQAISEDQMREILVV